jgi:hypothetical protein
LIGIVRNSSQGFSARVLLIVCPRPRANALVKNGPFKRLQLAHNKHICSGVVSGWGFVIVRSVARLQNKPNQG